MNTINLTVIISWGYFNGVLAVKLGRGLLEHVWHSDTLQCVDRPVNCEHWILFNALMTKWQLSCQMVFWFWVNNIHTCGGIYGVLFLSLESASCNLSISSTLFFYGGEQNWVILGQNTFCQKMAKITFREIF